MTPINTNEDGMSTAIPGIIRITKTFKIMKPLLFTGSTGDDVLKREIFPRVCIGNQEGSSGTTLSYDVSTTVTYSDN